MRNRNRSVDSELHFYPFENEYFEISVTNLKSAMREVASRRPT